MAGGLGSAKGDRCSPGPAAGESTEVASAKRVLRGVDVLEEVLDSEFVRIDRTADTGRLSLIVIVGSLTDLR